MATDKTAQHRRQRQTTHVLFVCTGNTCRSPMAAAYLAHRCRELGRTDLQSTSAGLAAVAGAPTAPSAVHALKRLGITAPRSGSRALTADLVREADLLVAMTRAHAAELAARFPEAAARTRTLLSFTGSRGDVADPFGGSNAVYEKCLATMRPALDALAATFDSPPSEAGDNHECDH